jgi:glycosyltransferase involved in cell wall biosynthesis
MKEKKRPATRPDSARGVTEEAAMRTVVHLTASTFVGGPERQMLGLARSLPRTHRSVFLLFDEGGRHRPFLGELYREGVEAVALKNDTPHFLAAIGELAGHLRRLRADVLCCHGYKANLLGRPAARRARVPVVAVSRGWTGESFKVRLYDKVDRATVRWMDRVVCVSHRQAARVRKAGVVEAKTVVISNAIDAGRFARPQPRYRQLLHDFFAEPCSRVVGAAGRLSRDKGFGDLIEAATAIVRAEPSVGFVLFGDGVLRQDLARRIAAAGLERRFVLAGFRSDLDGFMPFFDLLVLPSFTEGLPNVVLEAFAAGVPVVATAVGGTPEVVTEGVNGYLVPPGQPALLARRIGDALFSEARRRVMGQRGRERVLKDFTFAAQALRYQRLFDSLAGRRAPEALSVGHRSRLQKVG